MFNVSEDQLVADKKFVQNIIATLRRPAKFLFKQGCHGFTMVEDGFSCITPNCEVYTLTRSMTDGVVTFTESMDDFQDTHSSFEELKEAWA